MFESVLLRRKESHHIGVAGDGAVSQFGSGCIADPDDFWLDPIFENVRIWILT
jgi:hypothetical protein